MTTEFDNSILSRNDSDYLVTKVDGDSVMMHIQSGEFFNLNEVTTDIWNLLKTPSSLDNILAELQELYDVDPETCKIETVPVIQQMVDIKMIVIQQHDSK